MDGSVQVSKNMTNAEVAKLFREVAAVYSIRGIQAFRTQAYLNAATSVEQLGTPIRELWEQGKLEEVPGIGQKFHKYLDELFRTGHIRRLESILTSEPGGMYPLLDVAGIGPKTAVKLAQALKLKDPRWAVEKVAEAAKAGKIAKIQGFSVVSQAKILHAVEQQKIRHENRMLLSEAESIANDVINYVKTSPVVKTAEALGSLRRHAPTVGDIDIAVMTNDSEALLAHLRKFNHFSKEISAGPKMVIFLHSSGWQIDVKTQEPERWGSMLQHYTGSKGHNVHLRTLALAKGLSLSENGIKKGEITTTYADEESFYGALGLQYIPPELREDEGEVESAKAHTIPKLIELSDIKGDLHMHTDIPFPSSHDSGMSSVAELLDKAVSLHYAFIGLSDHGPKQRGITARERFEAVKKRSDTIDHEVAQWTKHHHEQLHVFKGLEVDILPSGTLALEDEAIALLDYMIVSVHSQFHPTGEHENPAAQREKNTQRILSAFAHPKAKILGHPTGRLISDRPEIDVDWTRIFSFAAEHNKYLEINASTNRLDLSSQHIREATRAGAKFVIDTDTHAAEGLEFMKYGIWDARRGWATPNVIANTSRSFSF